MNKPTKRLGVSIFWSPTKWVYQFSFVRLFISWFNSHFLTAWRFANSILPIRKKKETRCSALRHNYQQQIKSQRIYKEGVCKSGCDYLIDLFVEIIGRQLVSCNGFLKTYNCDIILLKKIIWNTPKTNYLFVRGFPVYIYNNIHNLFFELG